MPNNDHQFSRLLTHLLHRDNWEAVEMMDNWVWIFDRLPKRMKICVDLKTTGMPNKEIAKLLGCSVNSVCNHLRKAKKRFLRGENVI